MWFQVEEKTVMLRIVAALVILLFISAPVQSARHGAEVFKAQGCRGCHQLKGNGGTVGPALDGVGKRMNQKRLRQQIVAHETTQTSAIMPDYRHLPPAEVQALVDYLQGLK
jgi:mono/diheme cytochrome c family protein